MTMPETPIYEDNTLIFGQDYVRASWQAPVVGTVAQPFLEQETPDKQFCLGVPAFDGAHEGTSLCRSETVCHGSRVPLKMRTGHHYPAFLHILSSLAVGYNAVLGLHLFGGFGHFGKKSLLA